MNVVSIFNSVDPWRKTVEDQELPPGYTMDAEDGTWYMNPADTKAKPTKVCDAIVVRARVHSPTGAGHARIIEHRTPGGGVVQRLVLDESLHDTPKNLAKDLAGTGLWIAARPSAHGLLQNLLNNVTCELFVYSRQAGWVQDIYGSDVFLLPSGEALGGNGVMLRPECVNQSCKPSGSLEDWQEQVGKYAVGNSRFILSICTCLAGGLLRDSGMISGGFHFVGPSQIAKTTNLMAAGSVLGRPSPTPDGVLGTWSNTANAMEAVAARANDSVLLQDEMSQAEATQVDRIIYALGNGTGKGRMRADSTMRDPYTWRCMALSTGEETAEAKLGHAKRRSNAGVDVRLANIPADAELGHGTFEHLHGFSDFNALARHLVAASREYYGTAIQKFMTQYVELRGTDKIGIVSDLNDRLNRWVIENLPQDASGQVKSVARRFALCATAGEMAIAMDILPWPEGEASRGVRQCMDAWIGDRGDIGMAEDAKIIRSLQAVLTATQFDRFADHDSTDFLRVRDLAGVKKPVETSDEPHGIPELTPPFGGNRNVPRDFYVFCNQWSSLMPSVNALAAMKVLKREGLVMMDSTRDTYKTRFGWRGTRYLVYRISHKIFEVDV